MDSEMKTEWLKALRSGEYQQGIGYLKQEDAFCCLGVLCDISGIGEWRRENDGISRYVTGREMPRATLPLKVADRYSILAVGPLIEMNDNGEPFSKIADYIEEHL